MRQLAYPNGPRDIIEEGKEGMEGMEERAGTYSGSIFQYICDRLEGGILPEGFSLPEENDGDIHWTDGALDGVIIYHMAEQDLSEETMRLIQEGILAASEGNYQEADRIFLEIRKTIRAIQIIDDLQRWIIEHCESLNPSMIGQYGFHLLLEAQDRELVKIGLILMELLAEPDEGLKAVIETLGLSDEFTIFAIFNMRKWENGNEEIFRLARKCRGWGRIHAVEYLDAEKEENEGNQEIRDFLLREGYRNEIQNEYSALTCFEKAKVEERLRDVTLSENDFGHIGEILTALLNEGPVQGISALENPERVLLLYVGQGKRLEEEGALLSDRDLASLRRVSDYAKDQSMSRVSDAAEELLSNRKAEG